MAAFHRLGTGERQVFEKAPQVMAAFRPAFGRALTPGIVAELCDADELGLRLLTGAIPNFPEAIRFYSKNADRAYEENDDHTF